MNTTACSRKWRERPSISQTAPCLKPGFIGRTLAHAGLGLLTSVGASNFASAATLTLTTVVRTNDVAPGSRSRGDLPDGVFYSVPYNVNPEWSFGPPAASTGG